MNLTAPTAADVDSAIRVLMLARHADLDHALTALVERGSEEEGRELARWYRHVADGLAGFVTAAEMWGEC